MVGSEIVNKKTSTCECVPSCGGGQIDDVLDGIVGVVIGTLEFGIGCVLGQERGESGYWRGARRGVCGRRETGGQLQLLWGLVGRHSGSHRVAAKRAP